MYGYAGSSATAAALTPFVPPPTTTNGAGTANQSSAVATAVQSAAAAEAETVLAQLITQTPMILQSLSTSAAASTGLLPELTSILKTFNAVLNNLIAGPYTPLGVAGLVKNWWQVSISIPALGTGIQGIGPLLHPKPLIGALAPLLRSDILSGYSAVQAPGAVSAAAAQAGRIGSLSVPANWASAVPAVRMIASEAPADMVDAVPVLSGNAQSGVFDQTALSSLAGRAAGGTATRAVTAPAVRVPGAVAMDDIATSSTVIVIPPNSR